MAFKRSTIREIVGDSLTDDQIAKILDAYHDEVDAIKDELDEAKKADKSSEWETKYNNEHAAFESYKAEQDKKEAKSKKGDALKALLASEESTLSENGQKKALKYANLDSIELNADGSIKGAKKILEDLVAEWSEYVTEKDTTGTDTKGKDGAGTKGKSSPKTREEILNITDTAERQKAISENIELFRS